MTWKSYEAIDLDGKHIVEKDNGHAPALTQGGSEILKQRLSQLEFIRLEQEIPNGPLVGAALHSYIPVIDTDRSK